MIISLVVAHGKNLEIGRDNKLLWHVPEDLKQFKKVTVGHTLIMGRKTFDSIGRPLPGRKTVVITRDRSWQREGVAYVASSLKDALDWAQAQGESEAMVAGGGEIFKEALPLAHRLHVTRIDWSGPADVFFPDYQHLAWREEERQELAPSALYLRLGRVK